MLTVVRYNQDEYEFPCLLVLGSFDAIHKGHAELLKKAKLQAKINGLDLGVMVFKNGKGGNQICTFEEKLALIEQYNAKFVLCVEFTDEFKKTTPLDFLQNIEEKLNVKAYMSGKDFRFGAGAKGKSSTLKNYGEDEENGVWYMSVKDVNSENGEKISTSKIKELLESGDITAATALLGRNYSLSAEVISTAENGEETALTLAYPEGKVQVAHGNYEVKCTANGTGYEGALSYGDSLELHIKNFNGLSEGEKITVEIISVISSEAEVSVVISSEGSQSETEAEKSEETVEELAVTEEPEVTEEVTTPAEEPVEEIHEEPSEEDGFEEELNEEYVEEETEEQPAETSAVISPVGSQSETEAEKSKEEQPAETVEEPADVAEEAEETEEKENEDNVD